MLASDAGRVACTGGMAVLVASGAPTIAVYALAVGASVSGAVFRPAEASLVPLVAATPQELTAANVTASSFDSVGVFAGPALGAFLIAFSGYTAAFAVVAATFAWSALFVVRISSGAALPVRRRTGERGRRRRRAAACARCSTASARSPTSPACDS